MAECDTAIILIMALVYRARANRQFMELEKKYGDNAGMCDEAVLARAQAIQRSSLRSRVSVSRQWLMIDFVVSISNQIKCGFYVSACCATAKRDHIT